MERDLDPENKKQVQVFHHSHNNENFCTFMHDDLQIVSMTPKKRVFAAWKSIDANETIIWRHRKEMNYLYRMHNGVMHKFNININWCELFVVVGALWIVPVHCLVHHSVYGPKISTNIKFEANWIRRRISRLVCLNDLLFICMAHFNWIVNVTRFK